MGGGRSDRVAVIGELDRRRILAEGIAEEKVVVTGQPTLDDLHRAATARACLQRQLVTKYDLSPEKEVICCAVPQLFEHGFLEREAHLRETRWLFEMLSRIPAEALLSLHPKSDRAMYDDVASGLNVVILDEPLRHVLPIADVFVAVFSSTVRWATSLGIPTVVMDLLAWGFSKYDELPGVVVAKNKDEVEDAIKVQLGVGAGPSRSQSEERAVSGDIPLDGHATERLVRLIETWA